MVAISRDFLLHESNKRKMIRYKIPPRKEFWRGAQLSDAAPKTEMY